MLRDQSWMEASWVGVSRPAPVVEGSCPVVAAAVDIVRMSLAGEVVAQARGTDAWGAPVVVEVDIETSRRDFVCVRPMLDEKVEPGVESD